MENIRNPIDREFNVAVQVMCNILCPRGYKVVPEEEAPDTLVKLTQACVEAGQIVVTDAHGGSSIYDDSEINVMARAWHDSVHLRFQLPFLFCGEVQAGYVQIAQLTIKYGCNERTERFAGLLLSEVIGQVGFKQATGAFPLDQRAFYENDTIAWAELGKALVKQFSEIPPTQREVAAVGFGKADAAWLQGVTEAAYAQP